MFTMSKKNIIISAVILVLVIILVNTVIKILTPPNTPYISGGSDELSYSDVKEYLKKVDFSTHKSDEFFKDNLVNKYTLKFFKYLQESFKDLDAVKKYLYSSMEPEKADKLLEIYKKYLDYEKRLAAEINNLKDLKTTEDFLGVLAKMRKMQVETFGEKDADMLFGASLKSQEYPIRRAGIVSDQNLYGREKEEKIKQLNKDMWGNDTDEVEKNRKPYARYTEKIETYSKDLKEMSDAEKASKIKQFREDTFTPDVVQRLEEVDKTMDAEKQKEQAYASAYKEIQNDKELSEDQKKEKILNLQNSTFGEEADSFRRREDMEKQKIEMMNKYKSN